MFKRYFSSTPRANLRHLVSISELQDWELKSLVTRAKHFKKIAKSHQKIDRPLIGQTTALLFTKRSTRTRLSSEGAVSFFGGHPLFLGSQDIQLGVNESLLDSARVISSMTNGIFARVNKHSDIQELIKYSSVPIINSLCDTFHPLQAICDLLTISEIYGDNLEGKKLAWVGDSNNVINDLSVACLKYGIDVSVAIPKSYEFDKTVGATANEVAKQNNCGFEVVNDPVRALNKSDIIVTDTFVSMGEESQKLQKLKLFEGFQISKELIDKSNVNSDWKFMHCLPRHHEEVTDEVFYGDNSVVFQQAENRLYAAIAVIEALIINKGKFV